MTDADLTLKIMQTMRDEIRAFRTEILGRFDSELGGMGGEVGGLAAEVHEFRAEVQEFRTETRENFEMTNSRLGIVEHTLSGHTQQLASIGSRTTRRRGAKSRTCAPASTSSSPTSDQ